MSNGGTHQLRSFVRQHRNEILAGWKRDARSLPAAAELGPALLVDRIPELLDQITDAAESMLAGRSVDLASPLATAQDHALDRLGEGFDIAAVVQELSMLRGCVLEVWQRAMPPGGIAELRAFELAIDQAIAASVARYAEERERTFACLDRISTASLEAHDLDELLQRLLAVFVETAPVADTVQILLREGDRLVVRAVVGLEHDLARTQSVAIGEGFAGTIAARKKPLELRSAYLDPLVTDQALRDRGIRALYGVPLIQDNAVIGVAHMGSTTSHAFSVEDRQLFRSLAARATVGIHQHMLRADREGALAKLESLLAAAPVGIAFFDRELRYLRINAALAAINGRAPDAHIGRTLREMLPDVAPVLEPMLRGVIETGRGIHNVLVPRCPTPAGDVRSLFVNYFPVRWTNDEVIGVGGIVLDVTETRKAQDELRLVQHRLQAILEHAPAAIWVKDAAGRVILANHRLADALGKSHDEVIGHRSDELLPADVAAQHRAHDLLVMRDREALEVEESAPSTSGTRTFLTVKFLIPEDPPLVGGIATEITERKRMEDELRNAVRARDEVLAVVSHDLRAPLNVIELCATLLTAHVANDARGSEHIELIRRSCQRMAKLIADLLESANMRAGRLVLCVQGEAPAALIAEACALMQPAADAKAITLASRCDVAGVAVTADRERLLQVFTNLIGNAIKFCRAGDAITVSAERDGDHVRFGVADTGPGIAADALPRLFEAYYSAGGSSGLGLYISSGIVEGHGGRIWVESTEGAGATFYFTIPING